MFDPKEVKRLNIPQWEAVYRSEIVPGIISFIAIHDTSRGWALGGCRMANYDNEATALTDVLRLSRGMTFKNAISDLPLGGGKSIIVCDPNIKGKKREKTLEEFGKFVAWVNREKDVYCTAEDMNTTVQDMNIVKKYCRNIFGTSVDPSPYTAHGVFSAIEYAVDYFAMDLFYGRRTLCGKRVLIQGLGKVGMMLMQLLSDAGMEVYVTDIREEKVLSAIEKFPDIKPVDPEDIFGIEVDILSPAAKGEVITKQNVDNCKFKILCGPANNQLQNPETGIMLHKKGIVYCQDFIANMGGVCSIQYLEIENLSHEITLKRIRRTVRKMLGLTFRTAFRSNLSFNIAVDHAVRRIIWRSKEDTQKLSNAIIFPLTATSEP